MEKIGTTIIKDKKHLERKIKSYIENLRVQTREEIGLTIIAVEVNFEPLNTLSGTTNWILTDVKIQLDLDQA